MRWPRVSTIRLVRSAPLTSPSSAWRSRAASIPSAAARGPRRRGGGLAECGDPEATMTCSAPAARASEMPQPGASVASASRWVSPAKMPPFGNATRRTGATSGGSRPVTTASKRSASWPGSRRSTAPGIPSSRDRGPRARVDAKAARAESWRSTKGSTLPVSRSAARRISSRKPGWPRFSASRATKRLPSSGSEGGSAEMAEPRATSHSASDRRLRAGRASRGVSKASQRRRPLLNHPSSRYTTASTDSAKTGTARAAR